jgi:2-keto-4-pentenoate hydratase/2-oxohepta-3-ene-1,7-dioic acid hydratase in catechol pathway
MIKLPIAGQSHEYELNPSKIIALGGNYLEHVKESNIAKVPEEPVLFSKTPNSLTAPGSPIVIPAFLKEYDFEGGCRTDYEAELAMIVGRRAKNVPENDALDYIFGFTCLNDVSQRNFQKGDVSGWFRGKSLDTFGPIGPVIVPVDRIGDPQNLRVQCRLNGKTVQDANTADMIFKLPVIIAFISKMITLEPGDVITTGTPSGVGPIQPGDEVEVEIENIGILKNPVVAEI